MDINEILKIDYECDCKNHHKCTTQNVVVGEDLIDNFSNACLSILGGGHIALVYMEDCKNIAYDIRKSLLSKDYRVVDYCYASMTIMDKEVCKDVLLCPEDVRLIVGVGSGSISTIIRYVGHKKAIKTALFATAPSSISVFDNSCIFNEGGCFDIIPTDTHSIIFFDYNIMISASDDLIAGGYGEIVAESINYFDDYFIKKISNQATCTKLNELKANVLSGFLEEYINSNNKVKTITNYIARLGLIRQLSKDNSISSVDIVSNCIQEKGIIIKPMGINKFFAYLGLIEYYKNYLSINKTQFSLDNDIIDKCYNYAKIFEQESCDIFCNMPKREIKLINIFVYEEYKQDFYRTIKAISDNNNILLKEFRRLFDDVGLWIADYLSVSDILDSIKYSSIMCPQYSLLSLVDSLGMQ